MFGPDVTIYDNVEIGEGATLEGPCILGKPPLRRKPGELKLVIGPGAYIRPFTVIYAGTTIGARFNTGQGATIREDNILGDDCSVGTHATLEFGNRIGNGCRIHSGCFLEMVTLGDQVFCGPHVVFTDDPHPMGCKHYQECKGGAKVGSYVSIGANTTLCPGVVIGDRCLIGAGSLVSKDIPPGSVAFGHPAEVQRQIEELTCPPGFYERPYVWWPPRE